MGTLIITLLITIIVEIIVLLCIPKKYLPKSPPKRKRRRINDEYWTGLPWMGGVKKKRKNFWED